MTGSDSKLSVEIYLTVIKGVSLSGVLPVQTFIAIFVRKAVDSSYIAV